MLTIPMTEAARFGHESVAVALQRTAESYPPALVGPQLADVSRIAFHIAVALGPDRSSWQNKSVCDIGGGVGLFSVGCKVAGVARSVLIDDFGDAVNARFGNSALSVHRSHGVEILSHDAVAEGLRTKGPFDAVTSFDSMEHWHNSPRRLFRQVMQELAPGGRFVLGVPNCVNLRKRLTVPLGKGKWSSFEDWYAPDIFRGHVREPDVGDLRAIAKDLGLSSVSILGRNWTGHYSPRRIIRLATLASDRILRHVPSLCSDIYLVGQKPA